MGAEQLEAIRSVQHAAQGLTLACTEFVGPLSMALSLPAVRALADPTQRRLRREIEKVERKEGRT